MRSNSVSRPPDGTEGAQANALAAAGTCPAAAKRSWIAVTWARAARKEPPQPGQSTSSGRSSSSRMELWQWGQRMRRPSAVGDSCSDAVAVAGGSGRPASRAASHARSCAGNALLVFFQARLLSAPAAVLHLQRSNSRSRTGRSAGSTRGNTSSRRGCAPACSSASKRSQTGLIRPGRPAGYVSSCSVRRLITARPPRARGRESRPACGSRCAAHNRAVRRFPRRCSPPAFFCAIDRKTSFPSLSSRRRDSSATCAANSGVGSDPITWAKSPSPSSRSALGRSTSART